MSDEKTEEEIEVEEKRGGLLSGMLGKLIVSLSPITEKVRDIVLAFGELIVTVSVIVGVVTAIIAGASDMMHIGIGAGLSTMFNGIVNVVMGALVIFLLFAIYRNGEKPIKKK